MDRPQVSDAKPGRMGVWRNYALLVYTALALWTLLVIANAIIRDRSVRWDLTPQQRFSLSEFDRRVLDNLRHDVKVMAFVRTEDVPAFKDLSNMLFLVAAESPRVSYQIIDVNKAPGMAAQYGVSSYGLVIVESQDRRRTFDNARADLLIPAILQVSQIETKKIFFTVGHGEKDIFGADRYVGFNRWRDLMTQNNYLIENLSLFASDVPDDCAVLITIGPRRDFLPDELTTLARYLNRGGKFIAFIDPFGSPTLVEFLKPYHIDFTEQVVVDPNYRLSAGEILTTQIPRRAKDNPITRSLTDPVVFSVARAIRVTVDPGAKAPGGMVVAYVSKFLESSGQSWASADPKAIETGITEYKEGRDSMGPAAVGVEIDYAPEGKLAIQQQKMTRIVCFGSSTFAANQFIEMLSNEDLAVSVINTMAGDEMMIASRERLRGSSASGFYVTDLQTRTILYLGVVAEPALLFAIGIIVFIRRRYLS
ncbi:MAG: Gldg family protein [Candidatus Binataceae bacterium]